MKHCDDDEIHLLDILGEGACRADPRHHLACVIQGDRRAPFVDETVHAIRLGPIGRVDGVRLATLELRTRLVLRTVDSICAVGCVVGDLVEEVVEVDIIESLTALKVGITESLTALDVGITESLTALDVGVTESLAALDVGITESLAA